MSNYIIFKEGLNQFDSRKQLVRKIRSAFATLEDAMEQMSCNESLFMMSLARETFKNSFYGSATGNEQRYKATLH